jgi:hypothetical protein
VEYKFRLSAAIEHEHEETTLINDDKGKLTSERQDFKAMNDITITRVSQDIYSQFNRAKLRICANLGSTSTIST